MNWSRERIEAMERYVANDRSDPFTLARCKLHMRNNIAGFRMEKGNMPWMGETIHRDLGEDTFYGATAHTEMRTLQQGEIKITFPVTVYRNMTRP